MVNNQETIISFDKDIWSLDRIEILGSYYKNSLKYKWEEEESFENFLVRFQQAKSRKLPKNSSKSNDYNHTNWYEHMWKNCDFFYEPNIGWKLHLNVSIENVGTVSKFLKERDYFFKYLSGWDGDEKTFTIYTGSFKKTKEVWKELVYIEEYLKAPAKSCEREIEVSPWVVGRFCVATNYDSSNFMRYWIVWMDMLKPEKISDSYLRRLNTWEIDMKNPHLIDEARISFNVLSSLFWAYFHW